MLFFVLQNAADTGNLLRDESWIVFSTAPKLKM